jgi:hypothetical protein
MNAVREGARRPVRNIRPCIIYYCPMTFFIGKSKLML